MDAAIELYIGEGGEQAMPSAVMDKDHWQDEILAGRAKEQHANLLANEIPKINGMQVFGFVKGELFAGAAPLVANVQYQIEGVRAVALISIDEAGARGWFSSQLELHGNMNFAVCSCSRHEYFDMDIEVDSDLFALMNVG